MHSDESFLKKHGEKWGHPWRNTWGTDPSSILHLYSLFTVRKACSPLRSMESEVFLQWTDYRSDMAQLDDILSRTKWVGVAGLISIHTCRARDGYHHPTVNFKTFRTVPHTLVYSANLSGRLEWNTEVRNWLYMMMACSPSHLVWIIDSWLPWSINRRWTFADQLIDSIG